MGSKTILEVHLKQPKLGERVAKLIWDVPNYPENEANKSSTMRQHPVKP